MQLFTATEYLKIDVANNFGLDKEDWDVRIAWFNAHEHELEALMKEAESPALYFAGVKAYREMKAGNPIGYPISLDATSSGIQIMAALVNCRTSALACNVLDAGKRMDAYTHTYQRMCEVLGQSAKIERKQTKQALMTAMYSSVAQPREIFGEGSEQLQVFYDTVKEVLPGAWKLNEALLGTWQPTNLSHDWVLPDNFHVHVKVMAVERQNVQYKNQPIEVRYAVNAPVEQGRSNGANLVHSIDGMIVREISARCMFDIDRHIAVITALDHKGKSVNRHEDKMVLTLWDHYVKSGFLSARILNYLDSMNMGHVDAQIIKQLIASMPVRPFKVLAIHDCFRVHPNYGNELRQQYNKLLSEIAESNILEYCVSQIVGYPVKVEKDESIAQDILNANYALS